MGKPIAISSTNCSMRLASLPRMNWPPVMGVVNRTLSVCPLASSLTAVLMMPTANNCIERN